MSDCAACDDPELEDMTVVRDGNGGRVCQHTCRACGKVHTYPLLKGELGTYEGFRFIERVDTHAEKA